MSAISVTPVAPTSAASVPRPALVVLITLAGAFLTNLTTQFAGTNVADIQGGVGASADEASWITTVYTVASIVGIVLSPPLSRTIGLRRYFLSSASIFAACAWVCAFATSLPMVLVARAIQGLAGGGFGPMAFIATFVMLKGPRLPLGISLLAFVLVVSVNAGAALSGPIEVALGWRGLFLVQLSMAALLIPAGIRWFPQSPLNWDAMKTDWAAIMLLAMAAGSLMLVFSQGTRRFWLDSSLIAWAASISIGAWIGFSVLYRYSPVRFINLGKLLDRRFGIPILLNLIFRASFAITGYVIPLQLGLTQSYRPLQTSGALWWYLLPQVAAFPLAWRLMHHVDGRVQMILGLLLSGLGIGLAAFATNQVAAPELRLSLVLMGVGQMLFLVPALLVGAGSLKPEDGPTATIAFNMTTVGGTTLGVGLMSHFVGEREKFHSSVLVDNVSWLNPAQADRLTTLAGAWAGRVSDDAIAVARATSQLAAVVRREAWLLAINDAFALMAIVIVVAALGVGLIGRCPPLSRSPQGDAP